MGLSVEERVRLEFYIVLFLKIISKSKGTIKESDLYGVGIKKIRVRKELIS